MRHIATVAILGALASCAAQTSDPAPTPPAKDPPVSSPGGSQTGSTSVVAGPATAGIDENLARLRSLQIFEVGGFLLNAPNCYGMPCPGHEQEYADAKEAQAKRLADFTNSALSAAAATAPSYTGPAPVILAEPQNNANCYNLPCPEDIAAAQAINNERACQLANIAKTF